METSVTQSKFSSIESLNFAYQSVRSLLHNLPDRSGVIFRPIYEENAQVPEQPPLNTEAEITVGIMTTVRDRGIQPTLNRRPYWDSSKEYNSAEVFGATIQSLDLHDGPLPQTVLPPEEDVIKFIESIKSVPHRAMVNEQFNWALDIAGNDILGALNLCWIGNRFMARGADQRAYPNIFIDADTIRDWNGQIAQFETYDTLKRHDAPGDNYYFWTHAFAALAFSRRGYQAKLAQLAFSRGTQIMAFVRKNIASGNQPNITGHQPASSIGRKVGLALAYYN